MSGEVVNVEQTIPNNELRAKWQVGLEGRVGQPIKDVQSLTTRR